LTTSFGQEGLSRARLTPVIIWIALAAWFVFAYGAIKFSDHRRERKQREEWEARAEVRTREDFLEAQCERATAALRSIATGPSGPAQAQALEALRINHNAELQRNGAQDEVVWKGDEASFIPELNSTEPN
jgi:hypothetical protein